MVFGGEASAECHGGTHFENRAPLIEKARSFAKADPRASAAVLGACGDRPASDAARRATLGQAGGLRISEHRPVTGSPDNKLCLRLAALENKPRARILTTIQVVHPTFMTQISHAAISS